MHKTVVRKRESDIDTYTSLNQQLMHYKLAPNRHSVLVAIFRQDGSIARYDKHIFKSRRSAYQFIKSYFNIDRIPRAK